MPHAEGDGGPRGVPAGDAWQTGWCGCLTGGRYCT